MFVEGSDAPVWAETAGFGLPVTVFAHGVTGSTLETAPLATATKGTRVLLDFRGHGRSPAPPPEAGYDHPAMRRDLEAVADAFFATRAVGVSMGAGAILNLLADGPARFDRIVLVAPASLDGPNGGAGGLFDEMAARLERDGLDAVTRWSLDGNASLRAKPWYETLIRERIAAMNTDGIPRALRGYVAGAPPVVSTESLTRITVPALILAHEGDPIHDVAVAHRLASLLPNATLVVAPEPFPQWDDPASVARQIAEFLDA